MVQREKRKGGTYVFRDIDDHGVFVEFDNVVGSEILLEVEVFVGSVHRESEVLLPCVLLQRSIVDELRIVFVDNRTQRQSIVEVLAELFNLHSLVT